MSVRDLAKRERRDDSEAPALAAWTSFPSSDVPLPSALVEQPCRRCSLIRVEESERQGETESETSRGSKQEKEFTPWQSAHRSPFLPFVVLLFFAPLRFFLRLSSFSVAASRRRRVRAPLRLIVCLSHVIHFSMCRYILSFPPLMSEFISPPH
eukprot:3396202-Rhodomonas_salina.1